MSISSKKPTKNKIKKEKTEPHIDNSKNQKDKEKESKDIKENH